MSARAKLLEAVVEAARKWHAFEAEQPERNNPRYDLWSELDEALAALDAQPAQETVTLAVWEHPDGRMDFLSDQFGLMHPWTRLGAVTLPLNRERGA